MISERRKNAILEMAKRGTPEEQEIAKTIIDNLDISINDEQIIDAVFKYKNKYEKKILMQVWAMVINKTGVSYFTNPKKKNSIIFEITEVQKIEIELYYSIYRREIKEEIDLTVSAFIQKNNIFPQKSIDNPDTVVSQEDKDKLRRMFERMQTIDKTHVRKQIEC